MSYTTLTALKDRFGVQMLINLTDRNEDGEIDTAAVNAVLATTDAQINGYLAGRYVLPLSQVPTLVSKLAMSIAIYDLHTYAGDEKITNDYKSAVKTLEAIANGTVRLDVAGVSPKETGGTGARVTDRDRPMTAKNLKGFI